MPTQHELQTCLLQLQKINSTRGYCLAHTYTGKRDPFTISVGFFTVILCVIKANKNVGVLVSDV